MPLYKTSYIRNISRHPADRLAIVTFAQEDIEPHDHDCFELVYVTDGQAVQQIGQSAQTVRRGDYYFIDRGSCHSYRQCRQFRLINCLFLAEAIDPTLRGCCSFRQLMQYCLARHYRPDAAADPSNRVFRDDDGEILRLLRAIQREYEQEEIGYQALCRARLQEVLVLTMRKTVQQSAASLKAWEKDSLVQLLIAYLEEHYTDKNVLQAFCRRNHYSETYVSRKFRQQTGRTVMQQLQQLRIRKSCLLLAGSEMPVQEVAHSVGYEDIKHYQRVFRQLVSLTPSAYRKLGRG